MRTCKFSERTCRLGLGVSVVGSGRARVPSDGDYEACKAMNTSKHARGAVGNGLPPTYTSAILEGDVRTAATPTFIVPSSAPPILPLLAQ